MDEPMESQPWLDEQPDDCCLLSEESLAECWDRPDEDFAWAYLRSIDGNGETNAATPP